MPLISKPDVEMEAELLTLSFQDMYVKWGANQPPRTGLHASSLLVSEKEWCVRRHVLSAIFPDESIQPESQPWDWKRAAIFENGWDLHKRWQHLFRQFARVVYGNTNNVHDETATVAPELDLTHYDAVRNLFFSPDAIIEFGSERYVVEIKGVKQESFKELTDDLQVAMEACETVEKAYYQCQLYMHLLELKKGILLIENKNNQDFKVWCIEYNPEMSAKYVHRIYDVKGATILARMHDLKKFPAKVCQSRGDALARSCPMRDTCFSVKEKGYLPWEKEALP